MHVALATDLLLAQEGQAGGNALMSFLPLIVIFVAMYFLLIRPQRRKQQEMQSMLSSIQVGDDVITVGGLHGQVDRLYEDAVDLIVSEDLVLRFDRSAIARVLTVPEDDDT